MLILVNGEERTVRFTRDNGTELAFACGKPQAFYGPTDLGRACADRWLAAFNDHWHRPLSFVLDARDGEDPGRIDFTLEPGASRRLRVARGPGLARRAEPDAPGRLPGLDAKSGSGQPACGPALLLLRRRSRRLPGYLRSRRRGLPAELLDPHLQARPPGSHRQGRAGPETEPGGPADRLDGTDRLSRPGSRRRLHPGRRRAHDARVRTPEPGRALRRRRAGAPEARRRRADPCLPGNARQKHLKSRDGAKRPPSPQDATFTKKGPCACRPP